MNAPKICQIAAFILVLILFSCKDNEGPDPVLSTEGKHTVLTIKLESQNGAAFLSITDADMKARSDITSAVG